MIRKKRRMICRWETKISSESQKRERIIANYLRCFLRFVFQMEDSNCLSMMIRIICCRLIFISKTTKMMISFSRKAIPISTFNSKNTNNRLTDINYISIKDTKLASMQKFRKAQRRRMETRIIKSRQTTFRYIR
jgi:hypothetical protein